MPGEPDPAQAQRTWVILTEAAEGGWSINGTGLRRLQFTALPRRPRGASCRHIITTISVPPSPTAPAPDMDQHLRAWPWPRHIIYSPPPGSPVGHLCPRLTAAAGNCRGAGQYGAGWVPNT